MILRQIQEPLLAQFSYLVGCEQTGEALVIDPVKNISKYHQLCNQLGLNLTAAIETHIHADFVSGISKIAKDSNSSVYLSSHTLNGFGYSRSLTNIASPVYHKDIIEVGNQSLKVFHTPGHTPEHISLMLLDEKDSNKGIALFSGDFVFAGDLGRPDLLEALFDQKGMSQKLSHDLYESAKWFLSLDDNLRVFPGHGAGSLCGGTMQDTPYTTVGREKRFNTSLSIVDQDIDTFTDWILSNQKEAPEYFRNVKLSNMSNGSDFKRTSLAHLNNGNIAPALEGDSTIIDCRTEKEDFLERHLLDSLHIPLSTSFPSIVSGLVGSDENLILVGETSECTMAAETLNLMGYGKILGYIHSTTLPQLANKTESSTVTDQVNFDMALDCCKKKSYQLIDVREALEYTHSHVPCAKNLPLSQLNKNNLELSREKLHLVYCQSGNRASTAVSALKRNGYKAALINDNFTQMLVRREIQGKPLSSCRCNNS